MAIRKIVKLGDESLRKTCKPQETFSLRLWTLLKDMADTMYQAEGVGLAAPQVGILRRCVVIDISEDRSSLIELINPEIIDRSEETQCGREGCLSLPGRAGIVTRPMRVTVRAQDRHGKTFELTGEGLLARAICHELDHLDGVLYIDEMDREMTPEEIEADNQRQQRLAEERKKSGE
ncbi:MAG: peptide deformylase [Clostridia bacterium]|nr:peptide deformylase [Clostridia bacterium]